MENPFTPKTQRGLRAFGKLIREWAANPDAVPNVVQDARTFLINREDFIKAMEPALNTPANGNGPDYLLRDDVEEVELIVRIPNRFTVVLPEEQALAEYQAPWPRPVEVPAIYGYAVDANAVAALGDDAPATYTVDLDNNNFKEFLEPFMAGYSCSQCR
ncbi:MAG: hypothetical protein JKY94_08465 [Rhodobacteraceae bacterium]|nr:hypothetical protein [Paracoccaceae bacterium]